MMSAPPAAVHFSWTNPHGRYRMHGTVWSDHRFLVNSDAHHPDCPGIQFYRPDANDAYEHACRVLGLKLKEDDE